MQYTVIRLALVFILFVPIAGYAGSFKVTPIKVYMEGDSKVTAIHVVNEGEEKVTVQLEAMEWSQDANGVEQDDRGRESFLGQARRLRQTAMASHGISRYRPARCGQA